MRFIPDILVAVRKLTGVHMGFILIALVLLIELASIVF